MRLIQIGPWFFGFKKRKMPPDRFDYYDGDLDDVVVNNVEMFRLEFLSNTDIWIKCYRESQPDIVIKLYTKNETINGFHETE